MGIDRVIKNLEPLIEEQILNLNQLKSKKVNQSWFYDQILKWTWKNPDFKTRLFRFIDVLPSLKSSEQIMSHLKEYFNKDEFSWMLAGVKLVSASPKLSSSLVKKQVYEMAKIFISGETPHKACQVIEELRQQGFAFTLDILGEAVVSEKEAEDYQSRYLNLMDVCLEQSKTWSPSSLIDKDQLGPVPSVNISVKATSLYSQIKVEDGSFSKKIMKNKLRVLFKKARDNFIFINLDMEQFEYKELCFEIFKELLQEPELKGYPHFGIVVQAYLKSSQQDLEGLISFAKANKQVFSIRLVKGAYWDSEVILAKNKNWPIPVWTKKQDTDKSYERGLALLFENHKYIKIAVASHNLRSVSLALCLHKKFPQAKLEFQVLYGMGDELGFRLKSLGYKVRIYTPMGELIPGMSYLVRRLLENTANESFILSSLQKTNKSPAPTSSFEEYDKQSKNKQETFTNFPYLDFSQKSNREDMKSCVDQQKTQLPQEVPLILEGSPLKTQDIWIHKQPSCFSKTISKTCLSKVSHVDQAVKIAEDFFCEDEQDSRLQRIESLKKLSQLLKKDITRLASLQVFEVGKSWQEAYADVAEAIDFCDYYLESYLNLISPRQTSQISGEVSLLHYKPIGPCAVIAPWNFPLAILTGMTVAPLLCGNPVLIKPAEQSSLIAYELAKLLLKSGWDKRSWAFLPGKGEEVGAYLVKHPRVPLISFTGSFEVGAQILKEQGQISKKQKEIKRCVVEMGGKNAIVIDESADLDEAIKGVLNSAFGFQGQKCSACSRLIIVDSVYDDFIKRFKPAVASLSMGEPEFPQFAIGPVIDEQAYNRLNSLKKRIKESESEVIYESDSKTQQQGYFIPPFVFFVKDPNHFFMQEEAFGPFLACLKARDFNEACSLLNDSQYGLTAGLYSRHPGNIKKFQQRAEVGNVYINRDCTGAQVKRHPFGGIKMSGLGSKTGGGEYLKQFMHEKTVTENTTRRGFSPELLS